MVASCPPREIIESREEKNERSKQTKKHAKCIKLKEEHEILINASEHRNDKHNNDYSTNDDAEDIDSTFQQCSETSSKFIHVVPMVVASLCLLIFSPLE